MNRIEVFTVNRREAPLPPLKGEVAERSEVGGVFQHSARNPSVRFVGSEVPPNLPAPLSGAPLAKPEAVTIHRTALARQLRAADPPLQGTVQTGF